jgi:serine/threonine protein kinase
VGSGGFSKVYLVRAFGKLMAMKVINKEYIISNDKANIINN